jgi:hypothetical protein
MSLSDGELAGAVARGWCSPENAHKEMDATLAMVIVAELRAALAAQPAQRLTDEQITLALQRAYSLGQTYWQQADSDSYSQNAKADATQAKFMALIAETIAAAPKD